jgi:putative sigma-54 modulation protein
MEIIVKGRGIAVTDSLKGYVEKKLVVCERYLEEPIEINVILSVERYMHVAEGIVNAKKFFTTAKEETDNMYISVDRIAEKLTRQMKKHKEKIQNHKKGGTPEYFSGMYEEEGKSGSLPTVEIEKIFPKPISVEDAYVQMKSIGYNFFVFRDIDTEDIKVVYKKKNGNLGLIETRG